MSVFRNSYPGLAGFSALVLSLAACAQADDTQKPELNEAGLSAQFVGDWQLARPGGEYVIVNVPIVSCEDPLTIRASGPDKLILKSPKGEPTPFDLSVIKRGIVWSPEDRTQPYSFIMEPKSADRFWSYNVYIGKADWDNPREYTRCGTQEQE